MAKELTKNEKISLALKNRPKTPEHKEAISVAQLKRAKKIRAALKKAAK